MKLQVWFRSLKVIEMIEGIDHIGVAVKNLDEALEKYRDAFGLEVYEKREMVDQKVEIVALKVSDVKIELLKPTSDESTVQKFIVRRGEGIHHLAFKVKAPLERFVEKLKEKGIKPITDKPSVGFEGKKIIFLHPKTTNGVLIELVEH